MTGSTDPRAERGLSEAAFFGFLVALVASIIGAGMYLIGPVERESKAPTSSSPPASQPLAHATPGAETARRSEDEAIAMVEKYFRLAASGKHREACALESPAYLRSDAQRYSRGSCEAQSRATAESLASRGLDVQLDATEIVSFANDKATVRTTISVGTQAVSQNIFLQYHRGKWWLTGSDDSGGDVGF